MDGSSGMCGSGPGILIQGGSFLLYPIAMTLRRLFTCFQRHVHLHAVIFGWGVVQEERDEEALLTLKE